MNFLFTKIDQCLQKFLLPTILRKYWDEMNQSLYYLVNLVQQNEHNDIHKKIRKPYTENSKVIKYCKYGPLGDFTKAAKLT